MIGKIIYLSSSEVRLIPNESISNNDLLNHYVIIEDGNTKILGEVKEIGKELIIVKLLGEFINNNFKTGIIRKPTKNSNVRLITKEELNLVIANDPSNSVFLGYSPAYNDFPIYANINRLFSNHLAIFGNSGSGKSYGFASLLQNIFYTNNYLAFNANIFLFDAFGEYKNAFHKIHEKNPNIHYKSYSSNKKDKENYLIKIPLWLLNVEDFSLLLGVDRHSQIPIIEKTLQTVAIFSQNEESVKEFKNHLISKAIINILYANETATKKRQQIFKVVEQCNTSTINLNSIIPGRGYEREFKKCFEINKDGRFSEYLLITDYFNSFIKEEFENKKIPKTKFYTLNDLETALNFTIISEGFLNGKETYMDSVYLKVKLHSIIKSKLRELFEYENFISREEYINKLLVTRDNKRAQIINFSLEEIDGTIAKQLTKIFSRMIFEHSKDLYNEKRTKAFHIVLEEAHRYVVKDTDTYLLGYNIFDRIAKEGRKYGSVLTLISQRPTELSETTLSQCSNFLIFKINHPKDVTYMKEVIPNISMEIIEKQKNLQAGSCIGFGRFLNIPMIIKMRLPNPAPVSENCNVFDHWMYKRKN